MTKKFKSVNANRLKVKHLFYCCLQSSLCHRRAVFFIKLNEVLVDISKKYDLIVVSGDFNCQVD